ncbi:MAG TPA: DUF3570 domain-containing protein [Polyangiales bacterium]|nr:DUF3570 domain-containing protein [Polyangiales bacterium]
MPAQVWAEGDSLSSGVYVRADGDDTTVVSPHAHVRKRVLDATDVDLSYRADIWTSASVDIRASASLPVTEQRDELQAGVSHEWTDVTLAGSYRYSVENDYVSHGAFANGTYDFAGNNASLTAAAYALFDTVGRAGGPAFSQPLRSVGGRLSFTQVLDAQMFVQFTYELTHLDGYQASPYRKVGLDGTGFGCVAASLCLDEHEPSLRTRHAAAVQLRRALSEAFSAGASYRFIVDDWGLSSHTAALEIGVMLGASSLLGLRYRFYTQSGVNFYQARYVSPSSEGAYTTRDREQSPMHDQRIALDFEQKVPLPDDSALSIVVGLAGSRFDYDDFVGLVRVFAWEATLSLAYLR